MTSRRTFLKSSVTLAASTTFTAPAIARSRASANDRVRVGLGGRGRVSHCTALRQLEKENVEIAAFCDCDENRVNRALAEQQKPRRSTTISKPTHC